MTGQVCIVTGSNRGIGKEVALSLAARGARVVIACRDVSAGARVIEEAKDTVIQRSPPAPALHTTSKGEGEGGASKQASVEGKGKGNGTSVSAQGQKGEEGLSRTDSTAAAAGPSGGTAFRLAGRLEVLPLDLGDLGSVSAFVSSFKAKYGGQLDVLVCNAGVMAPPHTLTKDGHETQFQANYLGHFLLTLLALPMLHASAFAPRVVNVSSSLSYQHRSVRLEDMLCMDCESYSAFGAYAKSKAAQILSTVHLDALLAEHPARDGGSAFDYAKLIPSLKGSSAGRATGGGGVSSGGGGSSGTKLRITVNSVHPGVAASDVTRHLPGWLTWLHAATVQFLNRPNAQASDTVLEAACSSDLNGVGGKFFCDCVDTDGPACTRDRALQASLWQASCNMVSGYLTNAAAAQ